MMASSSLHRALSGPRARRASAGGLALALAVCAFASMAAAPASDPYAPEANGEPFPEQPAAEAAPVPEAAPAPAPEAAPAPAEKPAGEAPVEKPAAEAPGEVPAAEAPAEVPASGEAFSGWNQIRDATNQALEKSGEEAAPGPQAETAPVTEAASGWKSVLNSVSALFFVLALIVACYVLLLRLRRHAPMLGGGEFAQPLGRLHLDPRFALHFVRVGERVLLLGVTAQNVSLLETFDAASFDRGGETPETETPQDFLAHLRVSGEALNPLAGGADDDEEIASLRGDIERLKRYLEEGPPRDPESK